MRQVILYTTHSLKQWGTITPSSFLKNKHTHIGRGKGVLFGYYVFAFVLLLITLHFIRFPLLKWGYGGGWVALHLNFTQPSLLILYSLAF